jgi:hypothetical protein
MGVDAPAQIAFDVEWRMAKTGSIADLRFTPGPVSSLSRRVA